MENLFDFLDEGTEETTERQSFKVTDDLAADWAVEKIKECRDERDRLVTIAEDKIAQLKDRIAEIKNNCASKEEYFKALLAEYFEARPQEALKRTKTQTSYQLLSGKLIRKHNNPKYDYDDGDILQYLRQSAPDYIDTVEKIKWGAFKKRLTLTGTGQLLDTVTGELLDFINVEPQPDTFDVKLG